MGEWGEHGLRPIAALRSWRAVAAWDRAAKKDGIRRRVFVGSMMDVFEERGEAIDRARLDLWNVIRHCESLDFLLLTKRPENWKRLWPRVGHVHEGGWVQPEYFSNVWFGASIEDQRSAEWRVPIVMQVPAAVRFLSYEPALGAVDLRRLKAPGGCRIDALAGERRGPGTRDIWDFFRPVDWVIGGGESGPGARECNVGWILSVVEQCAMTGAAVFVKQLGGRPVSPDHYCPIDCGCGLHRGFRDAKAGDPDEWPEALRVRQFPGGQP
jgi:protein gp37